MPIKSLMEKYAELFRAKQQFEEANKEVFSTQFELERAIEEVAKEIQAEARETKEDCEHSGVKVTVVRKFKKWYEWDKLSPKTRKLLEEQGAVKHEVDREMFDELVHNEEISAKERAAAFEEQEMTTSVIVKFIQPKK